MNPSKKPIYPLLPSLVLMLAIAAPSGEIARASAPAAVAQNTAPRPDPRVAASEAFLGPEFWWKTVQISEEPDLATPDLSLFGRALHWLLHQLLNLLNLIKPSPKFFDSSSMARYAIWAILLGGTILLAANWRKLRGWLALRSRPMAPGQDVAGQSNALPDPAQLMADAAAALRQGEAQLVIRMAFLAVISQLEFSGLIPTNRARTNHEHIEALRHSQAASVTDMFRPLALAYEKTCYGEYPIGTQEAEAFFSRCQAMLGDKRLAS